MSFFKAERKLNKPMLALFTFLILMPVLAVFNFIDCSDYHVNLHMSDITDSTHTYRIYSSWSNSIANTSALDSLVIGINPRTGDYYGANSNPRISSKNFKQWIDMCKTDIGFFNEYRLINTIN